MMHSLDPCPNCTSGTLLTYCTRKMQKAGYSTRYLRCDNPGCGFTGQEIIPAARRRVRTRSGTDLHHSVLPTTPAAGKMETEVNAPESG